MTLCYVAITNGYRQTCHSLSRATNRKLFIISTCFIFFAHDNDHHVCYTFLYNFNPLKICALRHSSFMVWIRLIRKHFALTALLFIAFTTSAQPDLAALIINLKTAPDSSCIDIYKNISDYYNYSQPDSAVYYLHQGINRFTASGYKRGIASLSNLLGRHEANHGNLLVARQLQNDALRMFVELGNKRGIATTHNSLGILDGMQGNLDSATNHFLIALRENQSIGYNTGVIDAYINLGRISGDFNNLDKALEYYYKALSLCSSSYSTRTVCNLYNNIAIIHGRRQQYDTALAYLQKALSKSNQEEYIDIYAYSLLNIGIVLTNSGQYDSALVSLGEALRITKEKGMKTEYANILINIANITGRTNPAKAIEQLREVVNITSETGEKGMTLDAYTALAEINKKTGNYKEVVSLMEQMKLIEDSISGIEKSKQIANLQAIYELEQTNNKVAQLKMSEQQQTMRRNILLTIVSALIIFIFIMLLYLRKVKQLNTALYRREQQLQSANSIKDKLFSIIGHDLRGPIGSMTIMLQLLEEETVKPEDAEMLHALRDQADATLDTLDKLLFWGKEQIKGKTIEQVDFAAYPALDSVIKLLSITAAQKQINILNTVPVNISIHADASHFDFIMRNLMSNAIKFSNTNDIIEISADTAARPGYIVFTVKDNGIGIPADKLQTVFDPFNTSEGTAHEKGTGIGLMLCKEFVAANGGELWAKSSPGSGTTFFCALKCAEKAA